MSGWRAFLVSYLRMISLSDCSVGGAVTPAKILLSFFFSCFFSDWSLTALGWAGASVYLVCLVCDASAGAFGSTFYSGATDFLAADNSFIAYFAAFAYSLYLFFSSSVRVAPWSLSRAAFCCFDSSKFSLGGTGIYTFTETLFLLDSSLKNHNLLFLRLRLCRSFRRASFIRRGLFLCLLLSFYKLALFLLLFCGQISAF